MGAGMVDPKRASSQGGLKVGEPSLASGVQRQATVYGGPSHKPVVSPFNWSCET